MEIAEFLLQKEGAEVTKAWNGQEIVELFRRTCIPFIDFSDKSFDSSRLSASRSILNGTRITNAFTEDRIKAKAAGMDEHVAKPVDVELLIKVIHKLVG